MKLAIVSDSHGSIDRLDILFQRFAEGGIQYVLHCGDFLVDGVVEIFARYPEMHFWIARGNCDVNPDVVAELIQLKNVEMAEVVSFELGGIKIASSHIEGVAQNKMRGKKVDIFCHGHTHRPKAEKKDGIITLNPGALCEDGKYFLLNLDTMQLEHCAFTCHLRRT